MRVPAVTGGGDGGSADPCKAGIEAGIPPTLGASTKTRRGWGTRIRGGFLEEQIPLGNDSRKSNNKGKGK
jgi:hypothetical protein